MRTVKESLIVKWSILTGIAPRLQALTDLRLTGSVFMPRFKSPYYFTCRFTKSVKCSQFNPKIFKKGLMPEPCRRCRFYLKRPQKNLDSFIKK